MANETVKRIVIKVTEGQHETLKRMADMAEASLSNFVRRKLGIPDQRKGHRKDVEK